MLESVPVSILDGVTDCRKVTDEERKRNNLEMERKKKDGGIMSRGGRSITGKKKRVRWSCMPKERGRGRAEEEEGQRKREMEGKRNEGLGGGSERRKKRRKI